MSAILSDRVDENSYALSGDTAGLSADSPTSLSGPLTEPKAQPALGQSRQIFENSLTQTAKSDRQSEPFNFTTFIDPFGGLRIPSSPLNEF